MAIINIDSDATLAATTTLNDGDTLLFKTGVTFSASNLTSNLLTKNNITVGYYGTGAKPIISGAVTRLGNTFTQDAPNGVWFVDLGHTKGGCISEDGVMLTFTSWIGNASTPTALANTLASMVTGSFMIDAKTNPANHRMYIKTAGNNPVGKTYIIAETKYGFVTSSTAKTGLVISDLDFQWLSVGAITVGKRTNSTLNNIGCYKMGGNYLLTTAGNAVIYYGGGLGFEHGVYNATVSNCIVEDAFDSAYSPQVFVSNESIDGVNFTNNIARRCGLAAMEIAVSSSTVVNSTVKNVVVDGLVCEGMGTGWSGLKANGYGDAVVVMNSASAGNCTITNNTIKNVSVNVAQNIIKTNKPSGTNRFLNISGTGIVTSLVNELSTTTQDINQYYSVSDSSGHTFAGKTTWFETSGLALPTRTILSR